MAHRFIVHRKTGERDSLKQPIKLVFTLTPIASDGTAVVHEPVVVTSMYFGGADETENFEWGSKLGFSTYSAQPVKDDFFTSFRSFRGASASGRNCCETEGEIVEFSGGGKRTMSAGTGGQPFQWSTMEFVRGAWRQLSVTNDTGKTQKMALSVKHPGRLGFLPISTFQPLQTGGTMTVPSELELQAYEVATGSGSFESNILTTDLLRQPLFKQPIKCKELPTISTWKLCLDKSGAPRLVNDDTSNNGLFQSIQSLASSFNYMRDRLKVAETSADDAKKRLSALEKSISEADLSTAPKSPVRSPGKLQVRSRGASPEPRLEERVTLAEQSLNTIRADLATGQRATADIHRQLVDVQAMSAATGRSMATLVRSPADRNPPAIEARVEKLAESLLQTQGDVSAVQKSCVVVHNRLSDAETSITANGNSLADLVDRRIPDLESKMADPLGAHNPPKADIAVAAEKSDLGQGSPGASLGILAMVQQQVAGLELRLPLVEARAEKLAKAFGQTLDNLTSVNKYLQATRQQVISLDAKLPALELGVQESAEAIAVTGERLTGLDLRVAAVEEKTNALLESVSEIRASAGGGGWDSTHSSKGSPTVFPDRGLETPLSVGGPSAAEPFPWLSLPQPLDVELPPLPSPRDL